MAQGERLWVIRNPPPGPRVSIVVHGSWPVVVERDLFPWTNVWDGCVDCGAIRNIFTCGSHKRNVAQVKQVNSQYSSAVPWCDAVE